MGRRSRSGLGVIACVLGAAALTGCITWEPPTQTAVSTPDGSLLAPQYLKAGDFDGDGMEDLAGYTTRLGDRLGFILWSDGDGTFTQDVLPGGRWPEVAEDFNGDGIDDLVLGGPRWISYGDGSAMRLYFGGAADGTRGRGPDETDAVDVPPATRYGVGDFDGNGTLDLVRTKIIFTYYESINPLLNNGAATFVEAPELGVTSGPLNAGGGGYQQLRRGGRDVLFGNLGSPNPFAGLVGSPRAVGDIDGDGDDDVAAVAGDKLVFSQWTGSAWAPFPPYQTVPVSETYPFVALLDLDGDDITDLAYADAAGPRYLAGTGDGGFPYAAVGAGPTGPVVFADVNGDELPDSVSVVTGPAGVAVHLNSSTPVG